MLYGKIAGREYHLSLGEGERKKERKKARRKERLIGYIRAREVGEAKRRSGGCRWWGKQRASERASESEAEE